MSGCSHQPAVRAAGEPTGRPADGGPLPAPAAPAPSATAAPAPGRLRDGLLTEGRLPDGFRLSKPSEASGRDDSDVPITAMPCLDLVVEGFMTRHAPPLEDVSVGLERASDGWSGHEWLDRYAPGRAAVVMAAVRDAALRCASYTATFPAAGTTTKNTVSTTGAGVAADDGLVLRISAVQAGEPKPYVTELGLVREGDVILTVRRIVTNKPQSGVEAVLPAAVAAYRAAGVSP
ncbi:hypothetical protein [Kitasatospora sp. NPDC093558]|uniref:hypothetical protein n=1 Tax=Kitasatospora sp. NPDC093558 TaxID=3155201 RepID=UPI003422D3E3